MLDRSVRRQTCHDMSVKKRAIGLKFNGWNVKADISGFKRPAVLNRSRPDIDATKGKKRIIIEVETSDSKRKDRKQHKNLRSYAKSKKNTLFMMRTCGL